MNRKESNKEKGILNAENEMLEKTLIEAVHGGGDVNGIITIINENDARLSELEEETDDDVDGLSVCETPGIFIPFFGSDVWKFVTSCNVRRQDKAIYLNMYNFMGENGKSITDVACLAAESGDEFSVTVDNRNMYGESLFAERFDGCKVSVAPNLLYVGNETDGNERHPMIVGMCLKYTSSVLLY